MARTAMTTTFIRETKGDDTDVEMYRGFVVARCGARLCARLAEGDLQERVAEFLQEQFQGGGIRAAVSQGRHITGAVCCALVDRKARGLERQATLLKRAVDAFWDDFRGEQRFLLPTGREVFETLAGQGTAAQKERGPGVGPPPES